MIVFDRSQTRSYQEVIACQLGLIERKKKKKKKKKNTLVLTLFSRSLWNYWEQNVCQTNNNEAQRAGTTRERRRCWHVVVVVVVSQRNEYAQCQPMWSPHTHRVMQSNYMNDILQPLVFILCYALLSMYASFAKSGIEWLKLPSFLFFRPSVRPCDCCHRWHNDRIKSIDEMLSFHKTKAYGWDCAIWNDFKRHVLVPWTRKLERKKNQYHYIYIYISSKSAQRPSWWRRWMIWRLLDHYVLAFFHFPFGFQN